MESSTEEKSSFLRIDTIWSEAENAFENIVVKEEIVSDLESDSVLPPNEAGDSDGERETRLQRCENAPNSAMVTAPVATEGSLSVSSSNWVLSTVPKKKEGTKTQNVSVVESTTSNLLKSSCSHDSKNYKIVKKRLRCGDCRSLVCPECCRVMISSLQSHFTGSDIKSSDVYTCKLCRLAFHSACALQAHVRIHSMDTPYVCPDCGLMYNNIYFLILHLINKCYHVHKVVRYKCKNCPGAYFTLDRFVQHVQDHMVSVVRCSYCSSLFSTAEEFNDHMNAVHQKLKVQFLNCYRCSLCSNVLIPKHLYQKHVDHHRDNSEFYEVDYQCLCGELYASATAFRAHIQLCNRKGILPPNWGFLQWKLKTHEVAHVERTVDDARATSRPTSRLGKICVYKNVSEESKEGNKIVNGVEVTGPGKSKEDANGKAEGGKEITFEIREKLKESDVNDTNEVIKAGNERQSLDRVEERTKLGGVLHVEDAENAEEDRESVSETQVHVKDEGGENIEADKRNLDTKDGESTETDVSKVFYDHIPCDHLGYVKAQHPESSRKDVTEIEELTPQEASQNSFTVVTELDEKTGLMTSRKVPTVTLEDDKGGEEYTGEAGDEEEDEGDGLSPKASTSERTKFKGGNSFFTCPFCVVLFQKHTSTFQQFRLHLECYHPDAALNITLSSEENKNEKTVGDTEEPGEEQTKIVEVAKQSLPKISSKTFPKKLVASKKKTKETGTSLETSGKEDKSDQDDQANPENGARNEFKERSLPGEGDEEEECREKEEKSQKDLFWSVKLSLEKNGVICEKRNSSDSRSATAKDTGNEKENEESQKESHEGLVSRQEKVRLGERVEYKKIVKECPSLVGCGLSEDGVSGKDERGTSTDNNRNIEMENVMIKKEKDTEESVEKDEYTEEKEYCMISTEDSSWEATSDMKLHVGEDGFVSESSKPKEKSRRESEVWSEFYESLKMAERARRNQKKKALLKMGTDKKSLLTDYSSKRVVKKPKRYRGSSDSDDSFAGNEDGVENESGSGYGKLENGHPDGIAGDGVSSGGSILRKKQKLLNRLQHVDPEFVDYLFNLINKKEKFDLYKRHSTLRASRYSQDLRSYRKKVLNGIKHRGRPHKLLRYQEIVKNKETISEKDVSVGGTQEDGKKVGGVLVGELTGTKVVEKKRGRPRKVVESDKVKERRRSDKEVDFIEKNFEREEGETSPSKRKRKLSSKLQYYKKMNLSDDRDEFSSGQVITTKITDSSRKFNCVVCKESFLEYEDFREHIVGHRLDENAYQCMECGECFVVRPSLEKHLHAFHKIKNTDKYITENECSSARKESMEEQKESEPLKENQCKVCKDQFDRAIDLTKHFRIHGMAFLKEFKKEGRTK